jgi:hypothetical protein
VYDLSWASDLIAVRFDITPDDSDMTWERIIASAPDASPPADDADPSRLYSCALVTRESIRALSVDGTMDAWAVSQCMVQLQERQDHAVRDPHHVCQRVKFLPPALFATLKRIRFGGDPQATPEQRETVYDRAAQRIHEHYKIEFADYDFLLMPVRERKSGHWVLLMVLFDPYEMAISTYHPTEATIGNVVPTFEEKILMKWVIWEEKQFRRRPFQRPIHFASDTTDGPRAHAGNGGSAVCAVADLYSIAPDFNFRSVTPEQWDCYRKIQAHDLTLCVTADARNDESWAASSVENAAVTSVPPSSRSQSGGQLRTLTDSSSTDPFRSPASFRGPRRDGGNSSSLRAAGAVRPPVPLTEVPADDATLLQKPQAELVQMIRMLEAETERLQLQRVPPPQQFTGEEEQVSTMESDDGAVVGASS